MNVSANGRPRRLSCVAKTTLTLSALYLLLALVVTLLGCIDQPASMTEPDVGFPMSVAAETGIPATFFCRETSNNRWKDGQCVIRDHVFHKTPYGWASSWSAPEAPVTDSTIETLYEYKAAGPSARDSSAYFRPDTVAYLLGLYQEGDTVTVAVRVGYRRPGSTAGTLYGRDKGPWSRIRFCVPDCPIPPIPPDTTDQGRPANPPDPTPPPPQPTPCQRAHALHRASVGGQMVYSGECHSQDWTFFTVDAREIGSEGAITLNPDEAATAVCGHNNETDPRGGDIKSWCHGGEWVFLGA